VTLNTSEHARLNPKELQCVASEATDLISPGDSVLSEVLRILDALSYAQILGKGYTYFTPEISIVINAQNPKKPPDRPV